MKIKIATGFIIFIGIFTLFTLWLFLIDVWQTDDQEKIILVAALGLVGAIVGGAISGGLTLIGVNLTIKNADYAERLKSTPEKIETAHELIKDFGKIKGAFQDLTYNNYSILTVLTTAIEIMEKDKVILKAIKISERSYHTVKKFDKNLKQGINEINRIGTFGMLSLEPKKSEKIYQELFQEVEECIVVLSEEDNKIREFFFN